LHPYAVPYYEAIKPFRKNMINSSGKYTINGTLFDFPKFVYETFDHFLHPETGTKMKVEDVIKNRLTDPKSYAQIFHTTDFKISLTNALGHVLKIAKQWVMPTNAYDIEDEEAKEKYKVFFNEAKDLDKIDFNNQAMLSNRHKELLEKAVTKKKEIQIFELIKRLGLWIILMCEGGSFSIVIFNGTKLVAHKSDKKYLIRKMSGKRQANKDKRKRVMTSRGSQIRRELEKIHQANVANIMEEYKQYLADSQVIFLHAPGINRSFFLTEGMPLKPYMGKIKPIILHTKKANFENIIDVFEKLTDASLIFSNIP